MIKLNEYYLHFLSGRNKNMFEKFKSEKTKKLNNNYDKLFFNFLAIVSPDKLNYKYNNCVENQIKYEISQKISEIKFKQVDKVINNLCYEEKINLYSLSCLSFFYNLNMIYNKNNIYCILNNSINNNSLYLLVNGNSDIYYINEDKLDKIKNSCYEIKNLLKPIYSITNYKINELKEIIAEMKIELDEDKKYKKKELYDKIIQQLNNDL